MKLLFSPFVIGLVLFATIFYGCSNSDGSLFFDKGQTAGLVKLLGTYEGPAHAQRIMGAMMTGVWTATFFQDDDGALKCKCTLKLHDSQNGWGTPTSATTDVKIYKGVANGLYDLRCEAGFSDTEPHWSISVNGISLTSGQSVSSFSLFDMSSYEVKLSRK